MPLARFLRPALVCVALLLGGVQQGFAIPMLLVDAETTEVLYAEDAGLPWHPASLTKMMTAYLTFEALKNGDIKPDDKLVCTDKAFKVSPSKVGLKIGGEIAVDLGL